MSLKKYLPTIPTFLERRKKIKANRLPKHLRPPAGWPLSVQLLLNMAVLVALAALTLNKDDYLSDAGPAITLIVCLLASIYTFIEARILRRRYHKIRGQRVARLNWWLSCVTLLAWAGTVAFYIP